MCISEEVIDALVGEIEDIIETSENRDELWLKFIVPLSFEVLEYCEKDLTTEDRNFIKILKDCYDQHPIDSTKLRNILEKIEEYKDKVEETDFYNKKHRYLLASMKSLSYFPISQEDWDNGILWIIVSGWIEYGLPIEWINKKLQSIKALLLNQ